MKLLAILLYSYLLFSQSLSTLPVDNVQQRKLLTVEDIFGSSKFTGKSMLQVKWFGNGKKFSYLKYDSLNKTNSIYHYDTVSGKDSKLVSGDELKIKNDDLLSVNYYDWSPGEKNLLFTELIRARSVKTGGTFYIYNPERKKIIYVIESELEQENAQFSPDGTKLGFVRGNNIFSFDLETGKETQLTKDGNDLILNGVFDWVYEEEFSIIKGWEWSPDSKKIAFWRLDQSEVPTIKIAKWDSLYFNFLDMHYPKPGARNSLVKIGVVDIITHKTVWMDLGENTDIYIPRIRFTCDPMVLSVQRLNRLQNKSELLFADVNAGITKTIITETEDAWIEKEENPIFLRDGKRFIWPSEKDGWKHLYLYDINGNLVNQITKGKYEIGRLVSVDERNGTIYYTSNERGTIYSDLYKINLDGSGKELVTAEPGTHSINMTDNTDYFLDTYTNANNSSKISLYNTKGKMLSELIPSNMSALKDYNLSSEEFLKFTTSDGVSLNASILKPVNFDSTKKYPVLIYNYSGPGSQSVTDRWGGPDYLWHQLLAEKGYIIFILDNRGTGGRGKEFKHLVYKNLGKWESNDMIEGAKYLFTLSYVDPGRIGIWGWSYGGYMAALTILKGAAYFKAAIAVAPVTDWRFYDDIYTERYMQTPELNPKGYYESSPISYADSLRGKLLIVHGTADDNVNFQNSILLTKELISKDKPFTEMFYPGKDHGIYGGTTRTHLFKLMTKFILDNL
jgi:dipeptidyl-peptidase-4